MKNRTLTVIDPMTGDQMTFTRFVLVDSDGVKWDVLPSMGGEKGFELITHNGDQVMVLPQTSNRVGIRTLP